MLVGGSSLVRSVKIVGFGILELRSNEREKHNGWRIQVLCCGELGFEQCFCVCVAHTDTPTPTPTERECVFCFSVFLFLLFCFPNGKIGKEMENGLQEVGLGFGVGRFFNFD